MSAQVEANKTIDASPSTEEELRNKVAAAKVTGDSVITRLKTDERVFARITDGIYREPASALRELIANAYDADATEVRIETDAPRFSKIVVRDNGHGLSEQALIHVICHIGGSLKRTEEGKQFNVVNNADATTSPGGRKLIGKLGIGLFSVSQLTHHLIIVTKVKGEKERRVCDILLMPQKEDVLAKPGNEKGFVTGEAQITTVPAEDVDSHGTEITLLEIRPFVRESLQSAATWEAIEQERKRVEAIAEGKSDSDLDIDDSDDLDDEDFRARPRVPDFHIGEVDRNNPEIVLRSAKLPWNSEDGARLRFTKLVRAVNGLSKSDAQSERVKLSDSLDSYLRMLWTLALSVPVPYIEKHPFMIDGNDGVDNYVLSNKANGKADSIVLRGAQSVASRLGLRSNEQPENNNFSVVFDDVELFRPITFPPPFISSDENKKPLMFYGRLKTDLGILHEDYRGGPLEFEAYLSWNQKIVPVEHNGVMIRINGASGIMFDSSFLKYQVSELTRLRQITAEIFVIKGLDAALNIDRESFNIAHPHYQYIAKWLHHALKQLMSRHKALQKGKSDNRLENNKAEAVVQLAKIVENRATAETLGRELKKVVFSAKSLSSELDLRTEGALIFSKDDVFEARRVTRPVTKSEKLRESLFEEKIKAVASLLDSYGLLDHLPPEKQGELLKSIVNIFSVEIKR